MNKQNSDSNRQCKVEQEQDEGSHLVCPMPPGHIPTWRFRDVYYEDEQGEIQLKDVPFEKKWVIMSKETQNPTEREDQSFYRTEGQARQALTQQHSHDAESFDVKEIWVSVETTETMLKLANAQASKCSSE